MQGLIVTGKAEVNRGASLVTIKPDNIKEAGSSREWHKTAVKEAKITLDDPALLNDFEPGKSYSFTIREAVDTNQ